MSLKGAKKKTGLNISLYTVKRICYEIYCKYVFFSENESDINDDSFNEDFIPSSSDSDSGSDVFLLVMSKAGKKHHHKKKRKNGPNSFNKQSQYKHQCPFRDKRQCWRTHRQPIWTSIRGCDVLRECSLKCEAKHPELLRSPKLKKHIATLSQILNLKDNELDILANFLGHDIRTHREYYRLPEESLQVAKMSKLLFTLESNFNPRQWHRRDFIFW